MSSFVELQSGEKLAYLMPATGTKANVVFLHGIMGSSKNWQSFMKLFHEYCPSGLPLAFDLPNHGASIKHHGPFTVAQAAAALKEGIEGLNMSPKAIIGHSFGGKVAALLAESLTSVEQLWILDSSLSAVHQKHPLVQEGATSAWQLLELLENLSWPQKSRKELVEALTTQGVSHSIALWMTTNLVDWGDGLRLIFEPQELKAMLEDFFTIDLWDHVPVLSKSMQIHLVQAEFGYRLSTQDEQVLAEKAGKNGFFHILHNSGHFVQTDNPKGLIELLQPYFR